MILSTLLLSVADLVNMIISLYIWILIAGVVMSWIQVSSYSKLTQVITRLCEPAYTLLHKVIPNTVFNGIDIAPLILIIGLRVFNNFLMRVVENIA